MGAAGGKPWALESACVLLRVVAIAPLGVPNSDDFDHFGTWPIGALHHRSGDCLGPGLCSCHRCRQYLGNVPGLYSGRLWPRALTAKLSPFL